MFEVKFELKLSSKGHIANSIALKDKMTYQMNFGRIIFEV